MKTSRHLSPTAASLAVVFMLLLTVGNLRAFGPGTVGSASGVSGGGTSTGGSHGTVSTSGGGRSTGSGPAFSGARGGVAFSNNAPRTQLRADDSSAARPVESAPNSRMRVPASAGQRVANGWSGTAVNTANSASFRASTNQALAANNYYGNRFGRPASWYGDGGRGGSDRGRNGSRNNRLRSGYSYYPSAYGPAYAPYLGYDGAYPYYGNGLYSDFNDGLDGGTPTVNTQYTDQGQDAVDGQANPAPQVAAQNQYRDDSAQGTIPNNGPDSLVEAVQQELIRRGYFGGKVDAMYGPDTKEALRKFQQDHHLADSGLINEATLHALQLD